MVGCSFYDAGACRRLLYSSTGTNFSYLRMANRLLPIAFDVVVLQGSWLGDVCTGLVVGTFHFHVDAIHVHHIGEGIGVKP